MATSLGTFGETTAKRLYVQPFVTKSNADELRRDLIAELRKWNRVTLARDEASADLVLGGGGEIWIKGYRSLNPRAGTSLANATAVYTGFLSVELRDARGDIQWSYLATPNATIDDVAKDLSKQIVKRLAGALDHPPRAATVVKSDQTPASLHGAGATFPQPVYSRWFARYAKENPAVHFDYDAVGSQEGVNRLLAGDVDFGASDNPGAVRQLSPGNDSHFLFIPSVVGAVVPVVNLPGVTAEVSLTAEILAGIYLGKITKWDDPAIRDANRGLRLPALEIKVIHRADGSGTSFAWTDYLSKTSTEWNSLVGTSMDPKWPTGRAAKGNEGVAQLVKELGGAIGYVEYIFALQNHLSPSKVRNRNGEFVSASLESIALAASHMAGSLSIVDSAAAGAYPIASFTWLIVPEHFADAAKRSAMVGFVKWMLGPGQNQAAALGYLALPKDAVNKARAAADSIH